MILWIQNVDMYPHDASKLSNHQNWRTVRMSRGGRFASSHYR